jgi:hypothetical protein
VREHELCSCELIAGVWDPPGVPSHIDNHHTSIAFGFFVFRFFFVFLFLALVLAFPALVAGGDLQPGALLSAALLLFATTDLFYDPGLEHGGENL